MYHISLYTLSSKTEVDKIAHGIMPVNTMCVLELD